MNTLLIDVGNTRIKWRLLDASDREPLEHSAMALPLVRIDELATRWPTDETVEAALVSNVASADIGTRVERSLRARWPAIRISFAESSPVSGGVVNGYADPRQLGTDRWMAMIGAHAFMPDASLLVCSFGTATTIDLVAKKYSTPDEEFVFVGGMILPGIDAMRRALVDATARLPDRPGRAVAFADNTDDAITTGILSAQAGAVERAWRDARVDVDDQALTCLVAGGSAATIVPLLDRIDLPTRIVPDLVLRGLAVLAREG